MEKVESPGFSDAPPAAALTAASAAMAGSNHNDLGEKQLMEKTSRSEI
ncbi:hypothetical protein [Noviherbaspirillum aridicola]|nr:hypothetical protein [Noviherbaspirillum aridicola]